jgi:hypothetical protein
MCFPCFEFLQVDLESGPNDRKARKEAKKRAKAAARGRHGNNDHALVLMQPGLQAPGGIVMAPPQGYMPAYPAPAYQAAQVGIAPAAVPIARVGSRGLNRDGGPGRMVVMQQPGMGLAIGPGGGVVVPRQARLVGGNRMVGWGAFLIVWFF